MPVVSVSDQGPTLRLFAMVRRCGSELPFGSRCYPARRRGAWSLLDWLAERAPRIDRDTGGHVSIYIYQTAYIGRGGYHKREIRPGEWWQTAMDLEGWQRWGDPERPLPNMRPEYQTEMKFRGLEFNYRGGPKARFTDNPIGWVDPEREHTYPRR